jgi:hypothetical protein
MLPVFSALKSPPENHTMAAIHTSGGSQKASRFTSL